MNDRIKRYESIMADELAVNLTEYMMEWFEVEVSSLKDPITEETLVMRLDGEVLDDEQSDAVRSYLTGWFSALQAVTKAYRDESRRETE